MNDEPDEYGVVGHPVAHSRSPFIHGLFAQQTGQNILYRLHDVEPAALPDHILDFRQRGGRGLNVTVPHKLAAAALTHSLSGRADRAGAVNTLIFEGRRIIGDNTDGAGLVRDLTVNLGLALAGRRMLLVGAGGAARGVLGPLLELEPAQIVIAGRTTPRAQLLAMQFANLGPVHGCGLHELPRGPFDLVINATSAGLTGEVAAIPAAAIGPATLCYDMSYAKTDTSFMLWSRQQGCARAVQGWGMLVEQAAESFQLWRGVRPLTAPVLALLSGTG